MRGLFLKIFAIFWLAQSLIFVISTALIVRQRFPSPNIVSEALDSNLQRNADSAINAYEAGGCVAFQDNARQHEPMGGARLERNGQILCATPNAPINFVSHFSGRIDGRQVGGQYVWLVPTSAKDGSRYGYVWFQPTPRSTRPERRATGALLHFAFPQLPVAIAVGGLTTFVLVLLFTRPLVRLRKAARELAAGNLSARVEDARATAVRPNSDEFQGLIHDFNHMAERLESLVGAHKLLLRDVSHELRSPLARLSVALELARDDAGREPSTHFARIEREAERLNQLIGQLLTLSSMEAQENTAAFRPLSLSAFCEELLPDAEFEAKQRSCTVVLQRQCDCVIQGDWDLLYRAIENVVRNAIRYTDPGTQVVIRLTKTVIEGTQFAMVEVTDFGPGIPEAHLGHIFRPFYRLDHARSSATGGFGVGLAITERAVRLHKGTIRAVNRSGGGTSIQMKFPVDPQSDRVGPGMEEQDPGPDSRIGTEMI